MVAYSVDPLAIAFAGHSSSRVRKRVIGPSLHSRCPMAPPTTSTLGIYDNYCVAADSKECADVGSEVLKRGGSAVDAAIATLLCVGVVNPHSMGLGGGFQMTVYDRASRTARVIDAREVAPAAASKDMFQGNLNLTLRGGLPVAVPGELLGYWEAHQRFGRLPWAQLFEPAIRICRDGHRVGFHMANALRQMRDFILTEPSMREVFMDQATGDILQENDIVYRPTLARTLTILAEKGAHELYTGEMARIFVEDLRHQGSLITLDDMASYRPLVKDPIMCKLSDGLTMYNVPPPGSGALMALILLIVDGFHWNESTMCVEENAVLAYHRFIEACKFAYANRSHLADEHFHDVQELIRQLTSREYADSVRARIVDNTTFEPDYYGAVLYQANDGGTAHVSILAPNGDAVSVTSSVNHYFGAKFRSLSTGIIPNDVMGDFSFPNLINVNGLPPFAANLIEPGKRPMSSMCPAIFVDSHGQVSLVIGAAGGTRITTGTAMAQDRLASWSLLAERRDQVTLVVAATERHMRSGCGILITVAMTPQSVPRLIVHILLLTDGTVHSAQISMRILRMKEDVQRAIDHRRLHHQLIPNELYFERGFDEVILRSLQKLGHRTTEYQTGGPIVVAVERSSMGKIFAYSDARKGGGTAGY